MLHVWYICPTVLAILFDVFHARGLIVSSDASNDIYKLVPAGNFSGWWLSHHSVKYKNQLGLVFPIYGKYKRFQTNGFDYVHKPDS